jgi:type II secretory pathway component PulJ
MKLARTFQHGRGRRAFTLVEVILAIGIAVGLLIVALVFYQQAASLRSHLIDEAERLSAIRLILDRLSADLHAAFEQPQVGFTGSTDSMEFVIAKAPGADPVGARLGPGSDLRRVSYYLTAAAEGTNFVVTGLDRTEESLLTKPVPAGSAGPAGPLTIIPAAGLVGTSTNQEPAAVEPLAETIRFARFRFWDGAGWLEAWDAPGLPQAVEISLGAEPLPENELPASYPYELFRRVVLLPGRSPSEDWWVSL